MTEITISETMLFELWDRQGQTDIRLIFAEFIPSSGSFIADLGMTTVKCQCSYCEAHLRMTLILRSLDNRVLWYGHFWNNMHEQKSSIDDSQLLIYLQQIVRLCQNFEDYSLIETEQKQAFRVVCV